MSERFDSLFSGLSEADAITILRTNPTDLPNPGSKYLAASRLGAASSRESLAALMLMVSMKPDNLIDKITKRKSIEALGRRKSTESVPLLIDALSGDDEPTVVNAVDAIARIRPTLNSSDLEALLLVALGPDNQKRAVVQAFTRLDLLDTTGTLQQLVSSPNPMVASAAHAYALKILSVHPASISYPTYFFLQHLATVEQPLSILVLPVTHAHCICWPRVLCQCLCVPRAHSRSWLHLRISLNATPLGFFRPSSRRPTLSQQGALADCLVD